MDDDSGLVPGETESEVTTTVPPAEVPGSELPVIAGLLRRVGAFLIDLGVFAMLSWVPVSVLLDHSAAIGSWTNQVAFAVTILYFGMMESWLVKGQSLGKGALRIKVVAPDGRPLSLLRSLARTLILAGPFFISDDLMRSMRAPYVLQLRAWHIILAYYLSLAYLLLFNRRSRQSLHDLVAGTYVVRLDHQGPVSLPPFFEGHLIAPVMIMGLSIIGVLFYRPPAADIRPDSVSARIMQTGLVSSVWFEQKVFPYAAESEQDHRALNCVVTWAIPPADVQAASAQIARIILENHAGAHSYDMIRVLRRSGIHIGYLYVGKSYGIGDTPAGWERRIENLDER